MYFLTFQVKQANIVKNNSLNTCIIYIYIYITNSLKKVICRKTVKVTNVLVTSFFLKFYLIILTHTSQSFSLTVWKIDNILKCVNFEV